MFTNLVKVLKVLKITKNEKFHFDRKLAVFKLFCDYFLVLTNNQILKQVVKKVRIVFDDTNSGSDHNHLFVKCNYEQFSECAE